MIIDYWDEVTRTQKQRDATPDELAQAELDRIAAMAPVVPQTVTRRQGIQALRRRGVTEAMVETEIAKIADEMTRDLALIEFRTSQIFERYRPLVLTIGTALGFDLDELFIFADGL